MDSLNIRSNSMTEFGGKQEWSTNCFWKTRYLQSLSTTYWLAVGESSVWVGDTQCTWRCVRFNGHGPHDHMQSMMTLVQSTAEPAVRGNHFLPGHLCVGATDHGLCAEPRRYNSMKTWSLQGLALPETNSSPLKWMLRILFCYWGDRFTGASC